MEAAGHLSLLDAAISGQVDAFEKASSALPKGAAAHEIKDEAGLNALHLASHHGHYELVAHLIDSCGFDANTQLDAQGRNALAVAVSGNRPIVVQTLLQRGASATTVGPHGPVVVTACTSGHAEVTTALLDAGADPNSASSDGMPVVFLTAAMAAIKLKLPGRESEALGGVECLEALLKAGATPNVTAPGGFTPLHVAAEAGSEKMTGALLTAGADPSAKNIEGQTAAAVAASWGHRTVAETLLRATAGDKRSIDELIAEAAAKEADQRRRTAEGVAAAGGASIIPRPEEPDDEKAESWKTQGNKLFVAGDFQGALEAYKSALRHKTDSAAVWGNAAAAALRLELWEDAFRDARVARTVDPKFVKGWYREGQAAEGLQRWEDAATAYFEAYLVQQPQSETGLDFGEMVKAAVEKGKAAHAASLLLKEEEEAGTTTPPTTAE